MNNKRTLEEDCFGVSNNRNTINSKQKGSQNERKCAKALESWTGYHFVRVPQSGGLRWKDSNNVTGDLICDEPGVTFNWTVETKHLKSITIKRTLRNGSHIFKIWEQAYSDAIRSQKIPMALLRANNMPSGEYYLILDAAMGGSIMSLNTPILFSGSNHKHCLIGFMLSDVKLYTPFVAFDRAVKRSGILSKSRIFNQ